MKAIQFLIQKVREDGYIAKAVDESIFTEGDTIEEIKRNISEAIECHFEDKHKPTFIQYTYLNFQYPH